MRKLKKAIAAVVLMALAFSCEQSEVDQLRKLDDSPVFRTLPVDVNASTTTNARVAGSYRYMVYAAEYLAVSGSGKIGRTVYFKNVGNKRLSEHFVAGFGLSLDGTSNVSYYIDETRPPDDLADASISSEAISRAMNTWDAVTCSDLGMYQVPSSASISTGFVTAVLGFGGSTEYVADVVHGGWLPGTFFDLLAEDGSTFILAATFGIIFTDEEGNPVDLNNDKRIDLAWSEVYYNDAFVWADGDHIDIETVALHESGHGLSQAHFGTAFENRGTGSIQFSPRAVMNAGYTGIQTEIQATDNAGHCTTWARWPD